MNLIGGFPVDRAALAVKIRKKKAAMKRDKENQRQK
jgi:hypothetical protein